VVVIDDGTTIDADRIVLTCPIPQAWALLAQSGVELPADLARFDYHRTIALLAVLDGPGSVPDPGGVQFDPSDAASPFGFVGDQFARGVSLVPALTFHASQPWSAEHWDVPPADLVEPLLARAAPWVGAAEVLHAEVVKWRFAGPVSAWPDACWTNDHGSIVIAGDSFAGAKVEGAFNSGLAAAAAVVNPPSSP
jgi:predicted NAD/FAD-dependent oxidoreductase